MFKFDPVGIRSHVVSLHQLMTVFSQNVFLVLLVLFLEDLITWKGCGETVMSKKSDLIHTIAMIYIFLSLGPPCCCVELESNTTCWLCTIWVLKENL